jgi:hypothetical protein
MFIKFKSTPSLKEFIELHPGVGKIRLGNQEILDCPDEIGNHILKRNPDNFVRAKDATGAVNIEKATQSRPPKEKVKRAKRKEELADE